MNSEWSKGIGQLLHDKRLSVPDYQRSYAWKKSQVQELFDDFHRAIDDDRAYYFLGSVVGCQRTQKPDEVEIVDGQQRLATTAILLAAIRDQLLELNETKLATQFEGDFLFHTEGLRDPTTRPNVSLNETDNDYFQRRVIAATTGSNPRPAPQYSSHRLIDDAAKVAAAQVRSIVGKRSAADQKGVLDKWVTFIREKARVIFIVVEDTDDAFMIFETLNDRGLDLTIADLTKNYLFMRSGRKHIEEAKTCWSKMTGVLSTTTDAGIAKTYIHHLWSSYYGVTRDKDLFKALRNRFDNATRAIEFTRLLAAQSLSYAALANSDSEVWNPYGRHAKRNLAILNSSLKVTQVRMLLLAVMGTFKNSEVETILSCCVGWSVRFLIAGGSPSSWESYYATRAKKIREGQIKTAEQLINDMIVDVPGDSQFMAAFSTEGGTTTSIARYFLNCLESAQRGEKHPHLAVDDPKTADLEHVLPQHPDPTHWPKYRRESHEKLIDRLGNMALLNPDENKNRKNGSFAAAKPVYVRSEFLLTRDVGKRSGEWNEGAIQDRQEKMARLAVIVWPLRPAVHAKSVGSRKGTKAAPGKKKANRKTR